MNKKQRFQAVQEMKAPDVMPVWSCALSQPIFSHGLLLPDVTGQDWYNADKITEVILKSIKNIGYDLAIPFYSDFGFGVPPLGGVLNIPDKSGVAVTTSDNQPVMTKEDWPKIKEKLATFDIKTTDPRMKSALQVIKNVSSEVGDSMPLVTFNYIGTTGAMFLFRPAADFVEDMMDDPEWVDEMCKVGTDWVMDFIRAQYEAGANSITFLIDPVGTLMISPELAERFNLANIKRVVDMVRKEFDQGVWIHMHGDMQQPESYEYVTKLVKEAGVEGFHFDENHPSDWLKENVVDKLGARACITVDANLIFNGTVEEIKAAVKDRMRGIGDGLGLMMAPSCQVLPPTPNENFKAFVDAVYENGKYPID